MASDNAHARALTLTDAVWALVVAGDGDVDELGGGVNVAEGDDGNVGVAALSDGLVVGPGVAGHQQAGLAEGGLDLVGEGAGGEPPGHVGTVDVPEDEVKLSLNQEGNNRAGLGCKQIIPPFRYNNSIVGQQTLLLKTNHSKNSF